MKILLDENESKKWLHILECEKTLEETSRFHKETISLRDLAPTVQEMCDGVQKLAAKSRNWPSRHKAAIMALVAAGKFPREIARELGMKESSVKHLVYTEKKARRKLEETKAELAEYRTPKPVLDYIEAHQSPAAEGNEPPIGIAEEKAESTSETIKEAMRSMVKRNRSVVYMMDTINDNYGTNYTKDDIVQMRSGL